MERGRRLVHWKEQVNHIENDAEHHKDEDGHFYSFEPIFVARRDVTTLAKPGDYLVALLLSQIGQLFAYSLWRRRSQSRAPLAFRRTARIYRVALREFPHA